MSTINPLGATSAATSAAGTGSGASASSSSNPLASLANPQEFLQLLVAQLQNQDPLNPTSGTQFISQTAQMTEAAMVDQLVGIEKQSLSATQQAASSQQLSASASLIGKQVTASVASGGSVTGVVSGVTVDPTTGPMLDIGSTQVALSAVQQVSG